MILSQLRREFAIRSLLWWIPIGMLLGSWFWGVQAQSPRQIGSILSSDDKSGLYVVLLLWMALTIYLLNAGYSRRSATRLDLALPLSPRRLWTTHILTVILSGLAILLSAASAFAIGNLLIGHLPLIEPGMLNLAVYLGAGMILTLAVLQCPQPSLYEIPASKGYFTLTILAVVGYLGLIMALSALPRRFVLAPLAIALLLGLRVYRSLPTSFVLAPQGASENGRVAHASRRRTGTLWLLSSTIWKSPFGNWSWLYLPVFAFHGLILSLGDDNSARIPYLFFTWIIMSTWILASMKGFHLLDPLPISRKRLFAVLVLPSLTAGAFGYGAGRTGQALLRPSKEVDYRFSSQGCCYDVRVPDSAWEIVWKGESPELHSPWGESTHPETYPLFKGSRIGVYNSFEAPRHRSSDFAAWQLSRAIEAVYGSRLPYQEIKRRYLEPDVAGGARLKPGGFTLLDDYPGLKSIKRVPAFPVFALFTAFPWLLFVAFVYHAHHLGAPEFLRKYGISMVFFLMISLAIGLLAANQLKLVDTVALSHFLIVLIRHASEIVPGGAFIIWTGSGLLLLGGYLLAQSQFQRVEASRQPFAAAE